MVRSASRPGEPEIIHNLDHSQKKLNPHKYFWAFHTEKQVGQISEYFPVEKFGLLWKVKIKQSWGRRDQSPAALGQSGGAFIKMANRPEIPDSYPFKSHLLALQPLSLLFRQEKNHFHKNDPGNINQDKTFFCYLWFIKIWNCVWHELSYMQLWTHNINMTFEDMRPMKATYVKTDTKKRRK